MNKKSKNSKCSIYKSIDLFLTRRSETLRRAFAQFIITLRGAGGKTGEDIFLIRFIGNNHTVSQYL